MPATYQYHTDTRSNKDYSDVFFLEINSEYTVIQRLCRFQSGYISAIISKQDNCIEKSVTAPIEALVFTQEHLSFGQDRRKCEQRSKYSH